MAQRHDIYLNRNETFQLALDYVDANANPINLDTSTGNVFTVRSINSHTGGQSVIVNTSTTVLATVSALTNASTGTFWFPAGAHRPVLFIPQVSLDKETGNASWIALSENTRYYYDIVVRRPATATTPAMPVNILSGYLYISGGITNL